MQHYCARAFAIGDHPKQQRGPWGALNSADRGGQQRGPVHDPQQKAETLAAPVTMNAARHGGGGLQSAGAPKARRCSFPHGSAKHCERTASKASGCPRY